MNRRSSVYLERMLKLHPSEMDLSLDRMWRFLAALEHPERKLPPVIHIAGTNGKGSVQAMIRSGLEASGASVHAYTSPHIVNFHERIRLAGSLIGEAQLCDLLEHCLDANAEEPITFFESTTGAALYAFAETKADWTILEVGLGGRLDATNVIDQPALTVITPVAMDHQDFLGNTLGEIASEKAGILKSGVSCVVARQTEEARDAIEARAEAVGAPLLIEGQDWQAYEERGRLIVEDQRGLVDLPLPNLAGDHQVQNAGVAVVALRTLGITEPALSCAMNQVYWPGRLQRLSAHSDLPDTTIILDVGHNAHAAKAIKAHLGKMISDAAQTILCLGLLKTRNPEDVLCEFDGFFTDGIAIDLSHEPRGHPKSVVSAAIQNAGLVEHDGRSIIEAIKMARSRCADQPGLVLLFGSFHVAEALAQEVQIPGLDIPN